jgi:hypothetical protein
VRRMSATQVEPAHCVKASCQHHAQLDFPPRKMERPYTALYIVQSGCLPPIGEGRLI